MKLQSPFTFASVHSLGGWPFAGLHLYLLRQFQGFWAVCHCTAQASSYRFGSVSPLPLHYALVWAVRVLQTGRSLQPFRSNPAVKPIRLWRPAYLVRWTP